MRLICTGIAICAALMLTGCSTELESETPTPTPTSTPTPLSDQERLDQELRTAVNVYGQIICTKLAENPDARISDVVESVVIRYVPASAATADRLGAAHRLLTDSAARYCPDQAARVAEGLAEG
ncbi:hypothetical protein [Glaciibacter sp. 2TAF33]|uniref:hypothetical protein n=1 Tax=Glaciibacter sp. 2TAF33 TaxID=3233015 RepID=UPI003F90F983